MNTNSAVPDHAEGEVAADRSAQAAYEEPDDETAPDDALDEAIGELIDQDEPRARQIIRSLMSMERYASPHPHPDHLERYAALYPDAPRIIFDNFDEQGRHRRKMESQFMKGSERRANLGQWLAFIIVLAVIGAGLFMVNAGSPRWGAIIIVAAFAGGVLLVIAGASPERRRGARKAESPHGDKAEGALEAAQEEGETGSSVSVD